MAKTKKEGVDWKGLNKKLRSEFDGLVETRFLLVYGLLFVVGGILMMGLSALLLMVIYITAVTAPQITTCESIQATGSPIVNFGLSSCPMLMIIMGIIFLAWAWGDKYPEKKIKVKKK